MIKFCPNCGEDLAQYTSTPKTRVIDQPKYDQTKIWKELVALADSHRASPPPPESLVIPITETSRSAFKEGGPVRSVIHFVFDRPVVPQGGVLQRAALTDGAVSAGPEKLALSGYLVEDGKIKMVDDVPIGVAYQVIDYWGGERQYKRWHLSKPVSINPSRHGDPYFMDDNLVAFGATWNDDDKLEDAMLELVGLFVRGIKNNGEIAIPLALGMFWQGGK